MVYKKEVNLELILADLDPFLLGGLMILSKYPIISRDCIIFTERTKIDSIAAKGVLYAKIALSDQHCFHLFNTHLQATYNDNPQSSKSNDSSSEERPKKIDSSESVRISQLQQLRCFLLEKTKNDDDPIVLVGDFNVNSRHGNSNSNNSDRNHGSEEYLRMMEILRGVEKEFSTESIPNSMNDEKSQRMLFYSREEFNERDMLLEDLGYHPATVGDILEEKGSDGSIREIAREVQLTHPNDQCLSKRLDYIFWLEKKHITLENNGNVISSIKDSDQNFSSTFPFQLKVKERTCRIEHFFIESSDHWQLQSLPFTQLSDHYGVSIELEYS